MKGLYRKYIKLDDIPEHVVTTTYSFTATTSIPSESKAFRMTMRPIRPVRKQGQPHLVVCKTNVKWYRIYEQIHKSIRVASKARNGYKNSPINANFNLQCKER